MKNMKKLLGAMVAIGFSTVATVNVIACGGGKAKPYIQKTDLSELPDNIDVYNVQVNDVDDFIDQFVYVLTQKNPKFISLWPPDIDIFKKGTAQTLQDSDIVDNNKLEITITATNTSRYFKGTKNISVNLRVT